MKVQFLRFPLGKLLLTFFLGITYLPLLSIYWNSFWDNSRSQFTLQWYAELFQDQRLLSGAMNSLSLALLSSAISVLLGLLLALGTHTSDHPFSKMIKGLNLINLMVPEVVFALALLSWFVILHFELGFWTLLIAHVTFSMTYTFFAILNRLEKMDTELLSAAADLGANYWQFMLHVLLPNLRTAILSAAILAFVLSFDDFLISYFVSGAGNDTLPIQLYSAMRMGLSPKLNALAFLVSLSIGVSLFATLKTQTD